ncbi:hypothetical protein Zmor_016719 [Zophobas morio]|uniref:Replication protein A C-terminal domain-containing protein n=1 Tax=Zophobas morio TaxID=2755281 RepID=A0AA38MBY6_9CUCU|nr:hypothetical protein Zmor_016719 [Zophobas morio]
MAAGSSTASRFQATVPLTVDSIIACRQPQFHVLDVPVQIVCLVGIIRKLEIGHCEATFEIQDHTGSIKAIIISETESEVAAKVSGITENHYAKVFGSVRVDNGSKIVLIMKVCPVSDCNVITHHLLQFHYFIASAQVERNKQLASANTSGAALADSLVAPEDMCEGASATPQFSDLQKLVFDIIKSDYSDVGTTRRSILRQFPAYQSHEVTEAVEFLINEGLIYHSVDQEHLKAA